MRLEEKYSIEEQLKKEEGSQQQRWKWVRRFIISVMLITLFSQCFHSNTTTNNTIVTNMAQDKKVVLQTGFPPTEHVNGLPITVGKSAATAFSPNPEQIQALGESWWDRLFPHRHVHLNSVQIPVLANQTLFTCQLSICESKKQKFGLGSPIPDLGKCLDTVLIETDPLEEGDTFAVVEWVPKDTLVLKKSKMYWLVVETPAEEFMWVYAQEGANPHGTAYQTELGWEYKLEGEPIPSAMIIVEEHK